MRFKHTLEEKGQIRTMKRFAWFPVLVESNQTGTLYRVWLETYYVKEEYHSPGHGWFIVKTFILD